MNFTDNRLEREMRRKHRQEQPDPAPAPRGMTCFRALLRRGR